MEGPLTKWTNLVNGWQYRWFVLDPTIGVLSYYTSLEKERKGERRGCVKLKDAQVGIDDTEDCTFTITVDNKTFHFQARDEEERQRWLDALQEVRDLHTNNINMTLDNYTSDELLADFDKRIIEADTYLQLLIDQEDELKRKVQIEKHDDQILSKIRNLIELIKQTIVCLQIAKQNALTPLANIPVFEGISDTEISEKFPKEATDAIEALDWSTAVTGVPNDGAVIKSSSALSVKGHELQNVVIPEVSYSSSEDELFYDPEYVPNSPASRTSVTAELSTNNDNKAKSLNSVSVSPEVHSNCKENRSELDDDLYDSDEDELGSVQNHGSVITYLLSQLRIGMDLTKITLPTFILEKRSTLEMYADFLAHADLWADIPRHRTPRARFQACLKWYLSAFHAGRKSSVAKKPYNPILGEIFRCYWNINKVLPSSATASENCNNESNCGQFPWAPNNSVVFLAEQVSHHPPISAFYAEHKGHNMFVNGHLWTKSKFLGLSIGVEMIGDAKITLLDWDEQYVVDFPSGYGRNILSVPWVELGGKCTVKCAKTGYHAQVEFKTKPFYGGKKDQVHAECFGPGDKKPFMIVEGEWNDKMFAKHINENKTEMFIDIHEMPPLKKAVQPRTQQLEYESRRLWQEVTYNLKYHKIEAATESKSRLEQKQREDTKYRKEHNLQWSLRNFEELGNNHSSSSSSAGPAVAQNNGCNGYEFKYPLTRRAEAPRDAN